jgi:23S rRNA pseudouridine1911/1915/1917 synthase
LRYGDLVTRVKLPARQLVRPPEAPEGSVVTVFRVPPEVAGQRLDVFLQSQFRRTSRTRTQVIVRNSAFDAAGRRLRPNDRVQADQHVFLWRAPWDEQPVPTEVPVLYEDEHLLAVDKPAHLPVHPTARYHHNTLIKILQGERPAQFVSLGHRLDRETSGVLLVAKSPACDRALKKTLEERTDVGKTYLALTWGVPADVAPGASLRCELPVELDPESRLGVKMRIGRSANALAATTHFAIEAVRARPGGRAYARVRCELYTGRQHQIRVHLASYGTPVVGDKLYGPDDAMFARHADGVLTETDLVALELGRHALHAARLSLPHPITGEPLAIESPLPDDLAAFWTSLGEDPDG